MGKSGAVVAAWGYGLISAGDKPVSDLINHFYSVIVGKYWDPERKHIDRHYATIAFPFQKLPSRNFEFEVGWSLSDLEGYLNTWSSVQHFIRQNGFNPVFDVIQQISAFWETGTIRKFTFPIFLRIGKVVK